MQSVIDNLVRALLLLVFAAGATSAFAAGEAGAYYERAMSHFKAGQFDEAMLESRNALQRNSKLVPAHVLLARTYVKLGRVRAAEQSVKRARELGAEEGLIWPIQAEVMLMRHEFDQIIATVPTEGFDADVQSRLHLFRGHALLATGRPEEASEAYARASYLALADWMPVTAQANAAMLAGDLRLAETKAALATGLAPSVAGTWNIKGDVLRARGDPEGALEAYSTALDREPNYVEARLSRASLRVALGHLDAAREDLDRLAGLMQGDPRYSYVRSALLLKSGQREAAQASLRQAQAELDELDPQTLARSPQLLMLAGLASFEAGQLERARGFLRQHMELLPGRRASRQLLARVLIRLDEPDEAIRLLEKATGPRTRDAKFLALMGEAYEAKGDHRKAHGLLSEAIKMAPEDRAIRLLHAFAQVNAGYAQGGLKTLVTMFLEGEPPDRDLGIRLARLRLQRDEHATALEVTRRLLQLDPADPEHLNLHATALVGLGEGSEARAYFEQALELDEGFVPAALNLARLLAGAGERGEARKMLMHVRERHPDAVAPLIALAELSTAEGDGESTLTWLQKARAVDPRSADAIVALARFHLRVGRPRDALPVVQAGLEQLPDHFELLGAAGRLQQKLGRKDLASAQFQRMVEVAGANADRLYRAARLQVGAGQLADALATLERAIRTDFGHASSLELRVEVLVRTGQLDTALAGAQSSRAMRPESARAHFQEGRVLLRLNRLGDARNAFETAHRIAPSTRTALALSRLSLAEGDEGEGRKVLHTWLEANPDDRLVEAALAERLLAARRYDAARAHLEHLIARHGESASALNNLAYALDRLDLDRSLDVARRAHQRAPESVPIADTLGWILARRGRPEEALAYLRSATASDSTNPEYRYHLAATLSALGRNEEALEELKRAVGSSSSFADRDEARKLLERLSR